MLMTQWLNKRIIFKFVVKDTFKTCMQVCDWIACLRPPVPPPVTNLRITGWFGAPVPFNGTATYVCARGTQFLTDPSMKNVTYTCQVELFLELTDLVCLIFWKKWLSNRSFADWDTIKISSKEFLLCISWFKFIIFFVFNRRYCLCFNSWKPIINTWGHEQMLMSIF